MRFKEVHILFEQSGTFKKVFEKYGYKVIEYDIENTVIYSKNRHNSFL